MRSQSLHITAWKYMEVVIFVFCLQAFLQFFFGGILSVSFPRGMNEPLMMKCNNMSRKCILWNKRDEQNNMKMFLKHTFTVIHLLSTRALINMGSCSRWKSLLIEKSRGLSRPSSSCYLISCSLPNY